MDELNYTTFEVARIRGVDESTIRRQCADGRIPGAFRGVLRTREIWMIPVSAIDGKGEHVLQPVSGELEGDQPSDPA